MASNPILMPKLGLTMIEGLLSSWLVKPGDRVAAGDVLFVVETDKIANDVEARDTGTILTIDVAEGDTVAVGTVLATWTGAGTAADADVAPPLPCSPEPMLCPPAVERATSRIVATPLARRLARETGTELNTICGTGPRGRIKAVDVRGRSAARVPAPARHPSPEPAAAEGTSRPATSIERVVARRLIESKQTIPHFYVLADADVTAVLALRKELNALGDGARISVNHCIITAAARGLAAIPKLNAIWRDGDMLTLSDIDIGVAVDSPRGLLLPVLRGVCGLPLPLVAKRADALVARARDGRLAQDDLVGGALSVSNVGMYGASFLVPIINPGQSAILGVGAPKQVFRPNAEGLPALRQEIGLALACDHRVHDGVGAAKLLDQIVKALETPLRLLLP